MMVNIAYLKLQATARMIRYMPGSLDWIVTEMLEIVSVADVRIYQGKQLFYSYEILQKAGLLIYVLC